MVSKIQFKFIRISLFLTLFIGLQMELSAQTVTAPNQCIPTPVFPVGSVCSAGDVPVTVFTEDFNTGFGVFVEDPFTGANDLTNSTSGDTPSAGTGPETTASCSGTMNDGEFVFLEGSSTQLNEVHCMSTNIDLTSFSTPLLLSFWYHMFGDNVGKLAINVDGNEKSSITGQMQTENGQTWQQGTIALNSSAGNVISLQICMSEGNGLISTFESDISIDHIQIFNGCQTTTPIAKKDRAMNSLTNLEEAWYSFNSTESQRLSIQTNGYSGNTELELFQGGNDPLTAMPVTSNNNGGPGSFSNIKQVVGIGPYLIRVKGKTDVNPYWLRLMSDQDILNFTDTNAHFANNHIRVMSSAGITGGCGVDKYCPNDPVTRAQMAIFMLKAIMGGNHVSPPASGMIFNDVSVASFGANFIEEFSTLGITAGCGGGNYCPDQRVTREQMAIFLLRAWYGSSYIAPVATPVEISQFSDISTSFAKDWIVQLVKEGITAGCGGGKYCPTSSVTRGQMAVFVAKTFSLDLNL